MKANNLSISIPNYGCNKNCPYCISKMTGYSNKNLEMFQRNLTKVFNISNRYNVNSISFTSKGEILASQKSIDIFLSMLNRFSSYFVCELQTNGIELSRKNINYFYELGLDTIAISIDNFDDISKFDSVFKIINDKGMTTRITVNLTEDTYNHRPVDYFDICKKYEIDQISFRSVTISNNMHTFDNKALKTREWIKNNIDEEKATHFLNQYYDFLDIYGQKIRDLPYGSTIFNVDGISFTYFDYCIQDRNNNDNIRSLIYHEDGHMSTTWYGSNIGRIL